MSHWISSPSICKSVQYRVREGTEAISRGMAAELGGRVVLDAPVQQVDQTASAVELTTAHGESYTATRAIVAIPCNALPAIEFAPDLPPALQQLTKISNEPATKLAALLPPEHTVRPHFVSAGGSLAGAWRYGRRINGFAAPPHDRLPDDKLIDELAAAFQVPTTDPQDTTIYRWRAHPYVPGCDIAFAPGDLTRLGSTSKHPTDVCALRAPSAAAGPTTWRRAGEWPPCGCRDSGSSPLRNEKYPRSVGSSRGCKRTTAGCRQCPNCTVFTTSSATATTR